MRCWQSVVISLRGLLLQNMFTVGKDSDDSSIYEMMCTAVFQKKMSQSDTETLYSLPTKQARGRDSISSTYDTFVPNQLPGLEQLIELQEKVKRGSLSMDEALERFSDWQRVQKGMDAIQQEKLRQLRASIINNREDDESVYDKINIIHHTPSKSLKILRIQRARETVCLFIPCLSFSSREMFVPKEQLAR
uniref:B cell scaffold protein with ankyrin repeats 1 n=1 Tax=Oncorhynchus mykiss TaxID=8022 RepID=A0A8C7M222_ONCMY